MVVKSMSYAKYDSYKDSGVDWLGEIPSDWNVKRLKYIFDEVNEKSRTGSEELLSVSQYTGVTKRAENISSEIISNAETLEGYKIVKQNQLVSNIMLAWNGSLAFSDFDGIVSPAYAVYELLAENNHRFFNYLLRSETYKAEYKRKSTGVVESRLRLYTENFYNIWVALPTIAEQTTIANFLDEKTAQIDQAISLKQRQIDKLNEYKQIVIQNAVTKGLNPHAKMKPSGIDWIGDIPENWEVKKLKYLGKIILGKMLCPNKIGNMVLKPYLKSKNIQWLNVDTTSVEEMWFSQYEMNLYKLKKDDLILSEGGEVGKTCIWNNELEECYIQNSAHKITFNENNFSQYFLYQFFTYGKAGFFDSIVNRVSIAHLTKDKLSNIPVIQPPLEEQKGIVEYIEKFNIKSNQAIQSYQSQIERLKEYKNILINQAVTGKIKIA